MSNQKNLTTGPKPFLLPHHEQLLANSDIAPEVRQSRGYRSVLTKSELHSLGFGYSQCRVPALLIPICGISGGISLYQIRPDTPRIKDGKPLKYETPARARMSLDIPILAHQWLDNPEYPLFITEGARKADAAVSHGLCCVALLGVWSWRGSNEEGGKVALPEWESIALKNRRVYIVFDSDVMEKVSVHQALVRLKKFLEHRGADVQVIYLPPQLNGGKMGLDDFFAASHTVEDLLGYASVDVRGIKESDSSVSETYRATANGLVWQKPTREGSMACLLTNFDARIVVDVREDDGAEITHAFEIEARLNGKVHNFTIPAAQFATMNWATEHLGAQAIVLPGLGTKDHARCAIQILSGEIPQRRIYTHLGWRWIDDEWVYLHGAGAVGKAGSVDALRVQLPGALGFYKLPSPPRDKALCDAVVASLRLLTVGPERITLPLFAAIWRTVMGPLDCALHLVGPTGTGKTELAALVQQHWGPEMTSRQLPGNWFSTGNALEGLAHAAKDAIFTIDDFAPTGTTSDTQRFHREADRILRAQGNRSGRQRMRSDATLRPVKPPRGLILSTGEDVPRGQSLRARLLVLECDPDSIRWEALTAAQGDARQGLYAEALAGFLQWLAGRYGYLHETLSRETSELRRIAHQSGRHRRTAQIVADLGMGLRSFLAFAQEVGSISLEESSRMWDHYWHVLGEVSAGQAHHHVSQEPALRFLELLSAALVAGRAHIASLSGDVPSADAGSWGWRRVMVGQSNLREEWHAQGERIGWIDNQEIFLEPEASFAIVQKLARDLGDSFTVTAQTLRRRLHERGYLASVDAARRTLAIRKVIDKIQRNVIHLTVQTLMRCPGHDADKSDISSEPTPTEKQPNVGFVSSQERTPASGHSPNEQRTRSALGLREEEGSVQKQEAICSCHSCGGTDFWLSIYGSRICRKCHPPAFSKVITQEISNTDYDQGSAHRASNGEGLS